MDSYDPEVLELFRAASELFERVRDAAGRHHDDALTVLGLSLGLGLAPAYIPEDRLGALAREIADLTERYSPDPERN